MENSPVPLRVALQAAENRGDADGVLALLTDDVVAMVPSAPMLEGREACAEFVRSALAELLARYDRRVEYCSAETVIAGDLAYDRGTFSLTTLLRQGGDLDRATGKYFWLLRHDTARGWRIARLIHSLDEDDALEAPAVPSRLETPRLVLARPRSSDTGEIFDRYAADPDVTRYLVWPRHRSVADTEAFIAFSDQEWGRTQAGPYLIRSRETGRLLGGTGLSFETRYRASTGYVIARDAWGQGFATEALAAMVDLAGKLGVLQLRALCHADHRVSQRVLEKGGFKRDESFLEQGEFPNLSAGVPQNVWRYSRRCDEPSEPVPPQPAD